MLLLQKKKEEGERSNALYKDALQIGSLRYKIIGKHEEEPLVWFAVVDSFSSNSLGLLHDPTAELKSNSSFRLTQ